MRAALLVLCGCSRLFGLEQPGPLVDARASDGRSGDSGVSRGCPALGSTPTFAKTPVPVLQQQCTEYVISGTRASAYCQDYIGIGTAGNTLVPVDLAGATGITYDDPKLFEHGSLLAVRGTMSAMIQPAVFQDNGTGQWTLVQAINLPFTVDARTRFGTLKDGPDYRVMVYAADSALHEVGITANGAVSEINPYSPNALGVSAFVREANMTTDGLRIVFMASLGVPGVTEVFYSDRTNVDGKFRTAEMLPGLTNALDPFLMADCSRLYFSTPEGVKYLEGS